MKKLNKLLGLSAITIGLLLSSNTIASADAKFKDVSSSHWANNAIQSAVTKGYFKGYSDGSFKPNAPVTREEFAVLMARVSNNDQVNESVELKDVKGRWSESGVSEAITKGFVDGNTYVKNGFKPTTAITRVEMVRWMVAGLEVKDEDYKRALSDTMSTIVPVAEYYKGGLSDKDYGVVSVALGTGLMNGYSDGKFNASKTTTRAEVAAILLRYEQVQDKKANEYQQLNELREVGLTGTNVETMATVKYGTNQTYKSIAGIIASGDELKGKNGVGTIQLHHYIIVDTYNKNPKSAYGNMFVNSSRKDENNYPSDKYSLWTEVTFKPSKNLSSPANFANAINSLTFNAGVGKVILNKYGVVMAPSSSDDYKKGRTIRQWTTGFADIGTNTIKGAPSSFYLVFGLDKK